MSMNLGRREESKSAPRAALDDEHGASAILIAFAMVVLLGFAAVALDALGMGTNERRQAQSAADVGALAAVQFARPISMGNPECTGLSGLALSRCNGAVEALAVANATLDDSSLADWTDASKCSSPPAGYSTVSAVSECVAFNSNNQRAWVRIPTIDNPTSIARAIGINSVATSANAIAGSTVNPPGGVLPFLLPGNAASTNYNCLKAGANPKFGSCDDSPVMGNFGSADFFLYGDLSKGWTAKCTGDTNGRLVANIARGVDHPLSTHPTGAGGGIEEQPNCPDYNAQPNMTDSQTGIGSNLEQGLLYGDSAYASAAYPGFIQDSSGYTVRNAGGSTPVARVDAVPLWNHLSTAASLNGTPCDDATVNTPVLMDACITWAKAGSVEVFGTSLADSGRFGWVPEIWEADFTGNPYHLKLFRPVYLDTTFYGCSASDCRIMYTPGVADSGPMCPATPPDERITCGTPGAHNRTLDAVTSWILAPEIVPDNAKTPQPGAENQREFNLID